MKVSPYVLAQDRAWKMWFINNHAMIRSDESWFKNNVLLHARELGYGMNDTDIINIGALYGKLVCVNCLDNYLRVPVNAGEFLDAIREGYYAKAQKDLRGDVMYDMPEG